MNALLKPLPLTRLTDELASACTELGEALKSCGGFTTTPAERFAQALKVVDWEAKHAFVPVSEQIK